MTTLVRAELEKLRTIGLPWALLATSTALTLALALLRAVRSSGGNLNARLAAGPLSTAHGLTDVLASPTYATILAMALGAAAGTLIGSQVAAVITVFAWAFLIEGTLGALSGPIVPYLPFQAAISLAGATLPGGSTPLPFVAATAVTVGAAFFLAAAAARITLPRDIT